MRGAIPPLPQYAYMVWSLVKHRDTFTLHKKKRVRISYIKFGSSLYAYWCYKHYIPLWFHGLPQSFHANLIILALVICITYICSQFHVFLQQFIATKLMKKFSIDIDEQGSSVS